MGIQTKQAEAMVIKQADADLVVATFTREEQVGARFWQSWDDTDWPPHTRIWARGMNIYDARNKLALWCLTDPLTSTLLMIDSDQAWDPETPLHLLEHDVDVVGAYSSGRYAAMNGVGPCVYDRYYPDRNLWRRMNRNRKGGLEEVRGIGAGMLRIRTDIFETVGTPWFAPIGIPGADARTIPEDLAFCLRCREAGIPIHVDWDAPIYHQVSGLETYKGGLICR